MAEVKKAQLAAENEKLRRALARTKTTAAREAAARQRLEDQLGAAQASLTESLEQQTATSEILHVISRSPTDVQPVLDAVAEGAARLCDASDAVIRRLDGQ